MKYSLLSNGLRIAYTSSGRQNIPAPLVLLHGFCEDASVWAPLLPLLRGIRLVRIDLPGFGGSDLPLTPGIDASADAVCAILNELGVEHCILAGHSMGGYVALEFARKYPERLAGLGLLHSHPYEDSPDRKENRRRGIEMLHNGKQDLYVAQLFPGLFAPAYAREHPEVVQALIRRGRRQSGEGIAAALQAMIDRGDHQDTLRKSTYPVLFVFGAYDAIIPVESGLAAAQLPDLADIHVLDTAGHMGMFESTEATARALRDFNDLCIARLKPFAAAHQAANSK